MAVLILILVLLVLLFLILVFIVLLLFLVPPGALPTAFAWAQERLDLGLPLVAAWAQVGPAGSRSHLLQSSIKAIYRITFGPFATVAAAAA
jgi:hypothetical protein